MKMTELERVKKEVFYNLLFGGYPEQAQTMAESIVRISGYFRGFPSRVIFKTDSGTEFEMYL